MNEQSDQELLGRFVSGDFGAFEALYSRHRRGLFGYALGVCGDTQMAADATQDVWLALIEGAAKFSRARNLRAYLFRSVRNRVFDLLRELGRAFEPGVTLLRATDPHAQAARAEEARRLSKALGELPIEQREVVLLRVHGELKFAEIAAVMGENIKTVESRHRLALQKLRDWLAGAEP